MFSRFVFFILLIFAFSENFSEAKNVDKVLLEIPLNDQRDLESLFDILINNNFGFTLFGDKPVSYFASFTLTPWENTLEGLSQGGSFWNLWSIWEKHRKRFEIKNFLLIKEKSLILDVEAIFLINKNSFISCVKKNKKIFETILKRKVKPQQVLFDIESGKSTLLESIDKNELLLGILLGYGKHNAILYNLDEKIVDSSKWDFFGDYCFSLKRIDYPHFAADLHSSETKLLQKKYDHLRNKLSQIYSSGDFFHISILKLTEN